MAIPWGSRGLGFGAIAIGVCAALVALPPVGARSPAFRSRSASSRSRWDSAFWLIRGERRLGGYAIAAGLVGLLIGYFATRSSTTNLDTVVVWGALFAATLRYATPLAFAALGGLFSERSGVVNIGLEGMMLIGAFFAVWGSDVTGSWFLGVLIALAAGGLMGLLHAIFSVTLRSDQIVGGTAINFLALGITSYFFFKLYGSQGTPSDLSTIPNVHLGFLGHGFIGDVFGNAQHHDLGRDPARLRHVDRRLQDADRSADPRVRRASACGGHGGHRRVRRALRRRDRLGHPRGRGRRVPLDRASGARSRRT